MHYYFFDFASTFHDTQLHKSFRRAKYVLQMTRYSMHTFRMQPGGVCCFSRSAIMSSDNCFLVHQACICYPTSWRGSIKFIMMQFFGNLMVETNSLVQFYWAPFPLLAIPSHTIYRCNLLFRNVFKHYNLRITAEFRASLGLVYPDVINLTTP